MTKSKKTISSFVNNQFDFIICSQHAIDKNDLYYDEYFNGYCVITSSTCFIYII